MPKTMQKGMWLAEPRHRVHAGGVVAFRGKGDQMHRGTSAIRGRRRRPQVQRASVLVTATALGLVQAATFGGGSARSSPVPASGYLFWTNRNWIGRARLNGTGVNQRFITGAAGAAMLAISSGYLYWANTGGRGGAGGDTIGRARLNGTDVNQRFITGARLPVGVAAAGGYIYWTNNATGTIGRAHLNGTGVDQRFIKTAQPNGPDAVVVGSGHIYWANDYTIGRASLNGTHVNQRFIAVPNGPKGVAGLAVNSRYIYWTDERGGEIGRAKLNGTDVSQRFIKGASIPTALGIDAQDLYWTNWGKDTIGRARLNGTAVRQRIIAIPGGSPNGVVVDPSR
jgi:virginiamycin B lyase